MQQTVKILGALILATALSGQSRAEDTGSIAGRVLDGAGKSVFTAAVMATLQPASFSGEFKPASAQAISDEDGTFLLEQLPPGTYKLCAEQRKADFLNPCNWSDTPILVTVGDGQAVKGQTISMEKGVRLTVRIDDPTKALPQQEGKSVSTGMLIGIARRGAPFQAPEQVTSDTGGLTLSFLVPADRSVDLSVARGRYVITDARGVAYSAKAFKVQAVANAAGDSTVTLRVGGVEP